MLSQPRRSIPLSVLSGILLKDKAPLEEVNGRFVVKKKAMEKKGNEGLPRVWHYKIGGNAEKHKEIYNKGRKKQSKSDPETLLIWSNLARKRVGYSVIGTSKSQDELDENLVLKSKIF